ncbi:unnamed protein product [Effrenium voratum]|nr:unnamed protein product [Effrenium voratum]
MLHFRVRDGAENYANCDGDYRPSGLQCNESPDGTWVISSLEYLDDILKHCESFGGFHSSCSANPADWSDYEVFPLQELDVSLKAGCDDYAACLGVYTQLPDRLLHGFPVYVASTGAGGGRFMGRSGDGWVITSVEHLEDLLASQPGSFGGFHSAPCETEGWERYEVSWVWPIEELRREERQEFQKFANTTVSFKAVANSGVCRSEQDFQANFRRCRALDCGGLALRKAKTNQFGEEEEPPVCFFFRRTQAELTAKMASSEHFDFYLAPESFHPDCCFKAFRDPAPACHIRWKSGRVQAFAVRVCAEEVSPCTYYCAAGFHCGYCGIQQHHGDKQQVLFSVWNHPRAGRKVENLHVADGAWPEAFGGEGMGMGAYCITDAGCRQPLACWQPKVGYTFLVRSTPVEDGSEISCSLHKPETGWVHFATHRRPEPEEDRGALWGLYSFIEDFGATSLRRSGRYSAWVFSDGAWRPKSVGAEGGELAESPAVPPELLAAP